MSESKPLSALQPIKHEQTVSFDCLPCFQMRQKLLSTEILYPAHRTHTDLISFQIPNHSDTEESELHCSNNQTLFFFSLSWHLLPGNFNILHRAKNCSHDSNNNDKCSERRNSRFFYCLLAAPQTVSNTYDQVARAQLCANHVQLIAHSSGATCHVPRGTKGPLSYSVWQSKKSHFF